MKSSKWQTREGKFKIAAILLWVAAAVQFLAGIVFIVMSPEEVDHNLNVWLSEKRMTIYEVHAAPAEKRAEFDAMRAKAITHMRMWHAVDVVAGIATALGAVALKRTPMRATVGVFVLFFFTTAVKVAYQWGMPVPAIYARVVLLWALFAAIVAAFTAMRVKAPLPETRAPQSPQRKR